MLQITVGAGRKCPTGKVVELQGGAASFAKALADLPPATEGWWSGHIWEEGKRATARWRSSSCVGIDLDYHDEHADHVALPPELSASILAAAREGKIPGSVFHLTPRGARVIFVFDRMIDDRETMARAARGAGDKVAEAIRALGCLAERRGLTVDEKALLDLARLLFSPRAIVEGVKRAGEVVLMRDEVYAPRDLGPDARVFEIVTSGSVEISEAVERYNRENAREFPRNSGDCPICQHKGCFGLVPASDPPKWSCFSESHAGAGLKKGACFVGDVLDLDAWEAKRTPVEHLKARGYLAAREPKAGAAPAEVKTIASASGDFRILRSNSYSSIVFILRTPELREKVLGRGALEFNEMSLAVTLNRRPIRDADYLRVRELCETELGEKDSTGYKFSRRDIEDAMLQVAKERPFHPVRDYLRSLVWTGDKRIEHIPEDVMSINATPLVVTMIRKFLISCVARAFVPGCKADNVLILVGPGGVRKSTLFRALAGDEWFGDSSMVIGDKDAYLKLHGTWIYEWAELEAMQRAGSQNAVKAFVTSQADRFRAPYAREMEIHPRSCVIVGTTNDREFLTDTTGNRRYWTIETPYEIAIAKLAEWRDQIWAEAVAAYNDEEPWYLRPEEENDLAKVNDAFMRRDSWEQAVRGWLDADESRTRTTVDAVLLGAIDKKLNQWTHLDEIRVAKILRTLGYEKRRVMVEGERSYYYVRRDVFPFEV
jgi:hypothetical protein